MSNGILLERVRSERTLILVTVHLFTRITITYVILIFIRATVHIGRVGVFHHRHRLRLEEEEDEGSTGNADKKRYYAEVF